MSSDLVFNYSDETDTVDRYLPQAYHFIDGDYRQNSIGMAIIYYPLTFWDKMNVFKPAVMYTMVWGWLFLLLSYLYFRKYFNIYYSLILLACLMSFPAVSFYVQNVSSDIIVAALLMLFMVLLPKKENFVESKRYIGLAIILSFLYLNRFNAFFLQIGFLIYLFVMIQGWTKECWRDKENIKMTGIVLLLFVIVWIPNLLTVGLLGKMHDRIVSGDNGNFVVSVFSNLGQVAGVYLGNFGSFVGGESFINVVIVFIVLFLMLFYNSITKKTFSCNICKRFFVSEIIVIIFYIFTFLIMTYMPRLWMSFLPVLLVQGFVLVGVVDKIKNKTGIIVLVICAFVLSLWYTNYRLSESKSILNSYVLSDKQIGLLIKNNFGSRLNIASRKPHIPFYADGNHVNYPRIIYSNNTNIDSIFSVYKTDIIYFSEIEQSMLQGNVYLALRNCKRYIPVRFGSNNYILLLDSDNIRFRNILKTKN